MRVGIAGLLVVVLGSEISFDRCCKGRLGRFIMSPDSPRSLHLRHRWATYESWTNWLLRDGIDTTGVGSNRKVGILSPDRDIWDAMMVGMPHTRGREATSPEVRRELAQARDPGSL